MTFTNLSWAKAMDGRRYPEPLARRPAQRPALLLVLSKAVAVWWNGGGCDEEGEEWLR